MNQKLNNFEEMVENAIKDKVSKIFWRWFIHISNDVGMFSFSKILLHASC